MTNLKRALLSLGLFAVTLAASEEDHEEEEEIEPPYSVLFAPFTLTVGIVAFYVLSRYVRVLPYTAVMFLIGTLMGIASALGDFHDHVNLSVRLWSDINSEVLLLVFLPGLIFKDAFGQNVHLFAFALPQLLIYAFPMVLGGTALAAIVGYYIFPFGWSFNLSMTFGSILAATDPVAVAALLEEVGAPPRLKVHVAGESLLNEGSAIVFFAIFFSRYAFELGFENFGEDVDIRKGIGMFCQKALGGFAAGIFFGLGLLALLFCLNRRFSREENVVQVTSVLAIAYLNYYVADFVWRTSGVIATVSAGLLIKLLGRAMVNDLKLLEDFLTLVEHLLNTILFTLGGVVWGDLVAIGERDGFWKAREWGYLILLYVLLQIIRGVSFLGFYPISSRIGLKTNWKETAFQIYGGLRGAVGIALAIALETEVVHVSGDVAGETDPVRHTRQVLNMVGGIAFMTLVINGSLAGPFLRKLGLADSTAIRSRIVDAYQVHFRAHAIEEIVSLLTQRRFRRVNFALVKHHVPYVADLTKTQLLQAVSKHKDISPSENYEAPHLSYILPYVQDDTATFGFGSAALEPPPDIIETPVVETADQIRKARIERRTRARKRQYYRFSASNMRFMMGGEPLSAQELRILFISLLKASYEKQIKNGELDDQHVLAVSIEQSLDFAEDAVSNGKPLEDFKYLTKVYVPIVKATNRLRNNKFFHRLIDSSWSKRAELGLKTRRETLLVERSMAVMSAHKSAQDTFISEFQDTDSELTEAGKIVLAESNRQYRLAEEALGELSPKLVEVAASHKFCKIILTKGIIYLEKLVDIGLLKESEAEPYVEQMEEYLDHLVSCDETHHPGEVETEDADSNEGGLEQEQSAEVVLDSHRD